PSRTRNPWSAERTPGGSSSGSAAGVAAGFVPLALGSQTAGSILRPAAYNGVVGFKPSYGRVSKRGVFPLAWSLDHVGILARGVEDCGLFLAAAAGHDPADPASANQPLPALDLSADPPAPRLRAYIEVGRLLPGVAYLHAQRLRRRIRAAMARSVARVDALLLPTAVDIAPTRETTGNPSLQAPFSLVGFPSLSIPSGLSEPE